MALLDLVGELTGTLPGLSPILAQTYINRALKTIYEERNWSFLVTDGVLICPAQITAGTAAITLNSATVTLDATASAAVQDHITGALLPTLTSLQFRPASISPASAPLYGIVAVDNSVPAAVVLTLDRAIVQATNATSEYQIYRALVTPPIADFKKWESAVDSDNAITLSRNRLTATKSDFDRMDPQRTASGLSYWFGAWGSIRDNGSGVLIPIPAASGTTVGQPVWELWPHPTSGQTWYVTIRRAGPALTDPADVQLPGISDLLIIERVLYQNAYPFAMANAANFPSFKNSAAAWSALIANSRATYKQELIDAKRTDREQQLQSDDVWNRGHGLRSPVPFGRYDVPGYPIDSAFLQSHLIRW